MKKVGFVGLVSFLSLVSLASCSGSNGNGSGEMKGHFDHKVTITFKQGFGQGYQSTIERFIQDFKQVEPNVTVDISAWKSANYDTIHNDTIAEIPTGEYSDLVVCYPDHCADYYNYGKLVKLDPYIENEDYGFTQSELEDFIPAFLNEGRSLPASGTWCLPFSKSTEAMFYNKDRLIGLDLSEYDPTINNGAPINETYMNNLTWDELFDHLCPAFAMYDADPENADQKLIETTETGLNSYVGYDSESNLFITLAQQYGYGYTSINDLGQPQIDFVNDGMKSVMKKFAEAAKKNYIATATTIGASYCSGYFKDRNCLMCIGSTAGVTNQNSTNFQVDVACIPQANLNSKKIISQGPSLCILDHGDEDRILASFLFYKFITNTKNSASWATLVGYLPVRTSSYTSESYLTYCDTTNHSERSVELLSALNAVYSANVTQYCFTSPAFYGSSTARSQVGGIVTNILKAGHEGTVLSDQAISDLFNTAKENTLKNM